MRAWIVEVYYPKVNDKGLGYLVEENYVYLYDDDGRILGEDAV